MPTDDSTNIVYFVVVYGLDVESRRLLCQQFPGATGGADPATLLVYNSVRCELHEVDGCMAWLAETFKGRYESLFIGISVATNLSWANVDVPPSVLAAVTRYDSELKVSFSSPPISAPVSQGGA